MSCRGRQQELRVRPTEEKGRRLARMKNMLFCAADMLHLSPAVCSIVIIFSPRPAPGCVLDYFRNPAAENGKLNLNCTLAKLCDHISKTHARRPLALVVIAGEIKSANPAVFGHLNQVRFKQRRTVKRLIATFILI